MDPYVYPHTQVLKNKFDVQDAVTLMKLERRLSMLSALELRLKTFEKFDFNTLKYIHKAMFGSVYIWAGEIRTIDIAKGNSFFCPVCNIESYADDIFTNLQKRNYLCDLSLADFCSKAADLLGNLNALHPFREGNGRATREFMYHFSLNAGYYINFALIDKDEYMDASIASMHYSNDGLETILSKIVTKK